MRITFSRVKGNSCGRLTTIFIPGKHLLHLLLSSAHIFSWLFLNFNILDQQYLSKSYLKWLYLRRRPISYIIPLKSSATVAADTLCECRSRTKVKPWKVEHWKGCRKHKSCRLSSLAWLIFTWPGRGVMVGGSCKTSKSQKD